MFHVNCSLRPFAGEVHYHVVLSICREGRERICGIITLHSIGEWHEFLKLCEDRKVGVTLENFSTTASETAEAQ